MARVRRTVEIEETHTELISKRFPGISLSHLVNDLLFNLHNIIVQDQLDLSELSRLAASISKENLTNSPKDDEE